MRAVIAWLLPLGLFSCATSSMHTGAIKQSETPYASILTVYVEKTFDFKKFDSSFYTDNIQNRFNDLRTAPVREQMEKTLKRNLSYPATKVLVSSEVFSLNADLDYSAFRRAVDSADVNAILLVNEDQYWETHSYSRLGSSWREESQPNSAFNCYLVDARTGDILWLARCTINGIFAGYENLNNMLARRITRSLKDNGYIRQFRREQLTGKVRSGNDQ